MESSVRLAVDIGGTFTDIVLEAAGARYSKKVLTTPRAPEIGFMDGVLSVIRTAELPLSKVDVLIHGTTLATNALIERKGAKTALVATEGFRDTLEVADESRFDQYDLYLQKPSPLVPRSLRFVVRERIDAQGNVRIGLDVAEIERLTRQIRAAEVESVAIALLHSYANAAHERALGEALASSCPGLWTTLSSACCPEIREYERTSTTCANAYVQPMMAGYLQRLDKSLTENGFAGVLYLVTSGGALTNREAAERFPVRLVESGPAGGAVLAGIVAEQCGERKALSFDMGGTTAKICLLEDFAPQVSRSFEVARTARFLKGSGLPLRIPVIELVEIGAGGGSIARVDDLGRITVGPDSAGAEPGPACYTRGGKEPTVTDADVVLGRIDPSRFAGGTIRLEPQRSAEAIRKRVAGALSMDTNIAAFGISEIVDETMATAARVHAIERGKTIGEYTLIAFGGAAPLHAGPLAEKLGIAKIIIPDNAGVGSAVGFLRAQVAFESIHSLYMRHDQFDAHRANQLLERMSGEARGIIAPSAAGTAIHEKRVVHMRYIGQGHEIPVALPNRPLVSGDASLLREGFEKAYEALFARSIPGAALEILTWSVVAYLPRTITTEQPTQPPQRAATPAGERLIHDAGEEKRVSVYWRPDLRPGDTLEGPAVIAEDETSTVVPPSFRASIHSSHCIVMEKSP